MGWTHYWNRPTELPERIFSDAVKDIHSLVKACSVEVCGFDGSGEPIFESEHVVFNGATPEHCEPFEVSRIEFDRRGRTTTFSYCKTNQKPYDLLVQAALIVFNHYFESAFLVTSDGKDASWQTASNLVKETLGYGDQFELGEKQ